MRVRDARFNSWPPVYQKKDRFIIKACVLTPFRLSLWQELFVQPVKTVWGLFTLVLLFDAGLSHFNIWSVFHYTDLRPVDAYWLAGGLFGLWCIDRFTRLSLSRFFCGKKVRITISPSRIIIGGGLFGRKYSREDHIMFSMRELGGKQREEYKSASGLFLTIGDMRRVKLTEICDPAAASALVANLNAALELHQLGNERDLDPFK